VGEEHGKAKAGILMEEYKLCEVCRKPYSELHHVIYKSQAKYLEYVPLNFKYLCPEHHRGNKSPHMDKKIDLQYKRELQAKVNKLITLNYYSLDRLKDILGISKKECERVVKHCLLHKEGYAKEDIVKRLLGGRVYDISD
jgi:hypothetical protein